MHAEDSFSPRLENWFVQIMSAEFEHTLLSLPENQFALAALDRILNPDPDFTPRLVMLQGPSGAGKSHAIYHTMTQFLERFEDVRYRSLPVYEFASLNLESATSGSSLPQLEQLAELDLLVCEELHFIERQTWLQKKLIVLIDDVLAHGGRVIFTSQIPVGEFQQSMPKLISRCHAGITATIELPEQHSRISLLHHFAEEREFFLSTQSAELLASRLPVSPRELYGVIMQLEAIYQIEQKELTPDVIHNFLELQHTGQSPTLSEIAKSVAREFGVTVKAIRSDTRERSLLIPRQTAMLLSRDLIQANYADIGKFYGNRSHSTVMHACQALVKKAIDSPELDSRLSHLRRQLQGLPSKPR
ncbi:DnaA/Hda family protein [Rubinisphaera italica]|uniref:Chromosomal replication initiator protein DnaA n=1 Tax=Rubinisphaera italica TaxID=2527969 RepID=A0A5C5XM07_9PLAN|nr:helix-turn-helix domain-containing protein [Rubinisphaera italica]TWT63589.1 Chromosomal replication initiator protein DnaA [Rubinisphaera italica]